ncbi:MAG: DUF1572 family protein [Planctomycetota bacterium]
MSAPSEFDLSHLVVDAVRREFERYRVLLLGSTQQLTPRQWVERPGTEQNSIAILFQHLAGNLRSRFDEFLTTDGEKPSRNRDAEFEAPTSSASPEALVARLNAELAESWQALHHALDEVERASALGQTITIRGVELRVAEALQRSLAHVAYHTGQVVQLARMWRGTEWKSLSIPAGGSAAYNQDPTRERAPDAERSS